MSSGAPEVQKQSLPHLRAVPPPKEPAPPHDERIQRATIAACVLDVEQCDLALEILEPQHFYGANYQRLWEGVRDTRKTRGAIDVELLLSTLDRLGYLDSIGEPQVRMLVAQHGPSQNVRSYCEAIREHARNRTVLSTLDAQKAIAMGGKIGADWADVTVGLVQDAADLGARTSAVTIQESMKEAMDRAERDASTTGKVAGLATQFEQFDQTTGGLHRREVLLLGGRSGGGKSSLTRQWGANIARTPTPTPDGGHIYEGVFFAVADSMTRAQIATALACTYGGVSETRLRTKQMVETDEYGNPVKSHWPALHGAAEWIRSLPIFIHDDNKLTVRRLRVELRAWKTKLEKEGWPCAEHGQNCPARLSVVVFDTVQRFGSNEPDARRNDSTNEKLDRVGREIEDLALKLDFAAVVITQLNSEGGAFGAPSLKTHAQTLAVLKTAKNPPKTPSPTRGGQVRADLVFEKNRHGDDSAEIAMWFTKSLTRFEE